MKTIGSQEADYRAVKKILDSRPDTSAKEAIERVAKAHGKQFGSVQAAFYRLEKRNKANAAASPATAPSPPKKRPPTRRTTSRPAKDPKQNVAPGLDLNILRSTLTSALSAIDVLEQKNRANEEIINNLRKALSV